MTTDPDLAWELPASIKGYVHKYMANHISEKDIRDHVLNINPVPTNVKMVPVLDNYIKNLLTNNSKVNTLKNEKVLKTIQENFLAILGPLSRICDLMEKERDQYQDSLINDVSELIEQTVLLLGQAFNSSSFHRRDKIFSTLIDSNPKVKDILKEQSKDMDSPLNTFLFGEIFEQKLLHESNALQKSKTVFFHRFKTTNTFRK